MNDDRKLGNPRNQLSIKSFSNDIEDDDLLDITQSHIVAARCEIYAQFLRASYDAAKLNDLPLAKSIQHSVWKNLRGI